MPTQKPNALLRPSIEWAAALMLVGVWLLVGYCLATFHDLLAAWEGYPMVKMILHSGFAGGVIYLMYRGSIPWRYRRRLRQKRPYRLKAKRLKASKSVLGLGRGFYWQAVHTQRLREWELWRSRKACVAVSRENTALHGVGFKSARHYLPLADRSGHVVVLGTTGVGKTRLAEWWMAQDILRGDTVIVVDPKGDVGLFRSLVYMAQKAGRVSDVMALHLGFPEWSVAYNPVGRFEYVSEVAGRLTQSLPDTGDSAAFKAFAWQCVHTITDSLVRLGQTPTYRAIAYYLTHREALLEAVLKNSQPTLEDWLEKTKLR